MNNSAVTPPSSTRFTKTPSKIKTAHRSLVRKDSNKPLKNEPELKAKMQEASKNVPKYLFRMWHAGSGKDSELNTVSAVTPHAFAHNQGHESVYDMTRLQFVANTSNHVGGGSSVLSEFSSWSQSPYFVLGYAMDVRRETGTNSTIHIAIIDAEEMVRSNPAFNVLALSEIFDDFPYYYDEEYLVHGVVKGISYTAVPFEQLCKMGLLKHLPTLVGSESPMIQSGSTRLLPRGIKPFKIKDLYKLHSIALLYGAKFSFTFSIVLFCCRKHPTLWSTLTTSDLEDIIDILGGREKIPLEWTTYCNLLRDGVYPKGCEVNQQMVNVSRALYLYVTDPRNNSASSTISDSDEEIIVAKMSSVNVSPAVATDTNDVVHSPALTKLLETKSRKRLLSSLISNYTPFGYCATRKVPPSRISSPYALNTRDYHESELVLANPEVADLYTASRDPKSTDLDPLDIKAACFDERIIITWCVSKFNYRRLCSYKKLESWISKAGSHNEICKAVDFRCSHLSGEQLWHAQIVANFDVKINGQQFGSADPIPIGPLPAFSVWESELGVFFLFVGTSAVSYEAVPDHDDGDDAARKRQKREG